MSRDPDERIFLVYNLKVAYAQLKSTERYLVWVALGFTLVIFLNNCLLLITLRRQKKKGYASDTGALIYPFHVLMLIMDLWMCATSVASGILFLVAKPNKTLMACAFPKVLLAFQLVYALSLAATLANELVLLMAVVDRLLAMIKPFVYRALSRRPNVFFVLLGCQAAFIAQLISLAFACLTVPKTAKGLVFANDTAPIPIHGSEEAIAALEAHNQSGPFPSVGEATFWWQRRGSPPHELPYLCRAAIPPSRSLFYVALFAVDAVVLTLSVLLVRQLRRRKRMKEARTEARTRRKSLAKKNNLVAGEGEAKRQRSLRDRAIDCVILGEVAVSVLYVTNSLVANLIQKQPWLVDVHAFALFSNAAGLIIGGVKYANNGLSLILLSKDFRREFFSVVGIRTSEADAY